MADSDKTGWRRFVLFLGVTLSGTAAAWVVSWGVAVASTDPPQTRPFWIGVTFLFVLAGIVGLGLVAVAEVGPIKTTPARSTRRRLRKTSELVPQQADLVEPVVGGDVAREAALNQEQFFSQKERELYQQDERSRQTYAWTETLKMVLAQGERTILPLADQASVEPPPGQVDPSRKSMAHQGLQQTTSQWALTVREVLIAGNRQDLASQIPTQGVRSGPAARKFFEQVSNLLDPLPERRWMD